MRSTITAGLGARPSSEIPSGARDPYRDKRVSGENFRLDVERFFRPLVSRGNRDPSFRSGFQRDRSEFQKTFVVPRRTLRRFAAFVLSGADAMMQLGTHQPR